MTEQGSRCRIWNLALLGIGWLAGMALRLFYTTHANLYIDEFTTIWAAQRVLSYGVPRFPLGVIYTQGLTYTYLEAAALLLGGGFHPLFARLPSLLLSAVMLALMVYAARRLFRVLPVGLAAIWLALDGEAIVWGSRARTYALLQPLVLVAFVAWYRGAVAEDRPGPRWLAIVLLLVAVMDQQVTLLLLPPLAILALVARGWRWLRQPVVWFQAAVVVLGMAARWFLYRLMILPGTTAAAAPRSFVEIAHPFADWDTVAPFFTDPTRLLAVLLLAGGVIWLCFRQRSAAPAWRGPVVATAFVLALVILEMMLLVGTTWRRARYLYPLLPLLYLGAEGVAVPALRGLSRRVSCLPFRQALAGLTLVFVLLVAGLSYSTTQAAAMRNEWGYDRALTVVRDGWVDGDALATFAPAAAFVILGHCDYLAAEVDAQVLVVERGGQRLDSWTGLPLLDTPERLAEAVGAHSRLWFVVDEMRLDRHFSPTYLRLLWDRFDIAAFEWGTFVFRSRPPGAPPAVERPLDADLAGQLRLESYALNHRQPEPGQTVTVTLRWAPLVPGDQVTVSLRLVNQTGSTVASHEGPPLGGLYPVSRWQWSPRSQPFPDRHSLTLPADLPPGRYRLDVGLPRPDSLEPLQEWVTLDFLSVGGGHNGLQASAGLPSARFGDTVTLLVHPLRGEVAPGSAATLRLVWQTGSAGFQADYTAFIHLLDSHGQIAQQWDAPPTGGWYPTSYWDPGEVIVDDHELAFNSELAPGTYQLIVGLYRADGTRLSLDDGSDSVHITTIELQP